MNIDELSGIELRLHTAKAVRPDGVPFNDPNLNTVECEWGHPPFGFLPHYESDLNAAFDAVRAAGRRLGKEWRAEAGPFRVLIMEIHDGEMKWADAASPIWRHDDTNPTIATAICKALIKAVEEMEKPCPH